MNPRKHLFILNPKSFWHKWKLESVLSRIHEVFDPAEPENYVIHISQFPRDAVGLIRSYVKTLPGETTVRVYAVGGDGILFDCLNGIMGLPNMELAVIPYGRTNNFVRNFGKNNKPLFRDISLQRTASTIPLDVIQVGSNYGLNFCIIGTEALALLYAQGIQEWMEAGGPLTQWLNRRLYKSIYYITGIAACLNRKFFRQWYAINLEGENISGRYRCINIANGAWYGGNKSPIPSAIPGDGKLNILFCVEGNVLLTIAYINSYLRGHYKRFPKDFFLKEGRKITLCSDTPMLIGLDDILFFDSSLTVELKPGAVSLVDVTNQGYQGGGNE